MNQQAMGAGTRTPDLKSPITPLVRLADRPKMAPRVRTLLQGVLECSTTHFEKALDATFKAIEEDIFKIAEKAKTNDLQAQQFDALHQIKRGRKDAISRFLSYVESNLARLDEVLNAQPSTTATLAKAQPQRTPKRTELELVDSTELEERLALQEIASKAETKHNQALFALGYRFGVIAASPPFDAETLPLGPAQISEAVRYSFEGIEVPIEHRILIYRVFDRIVMTPLADFYDALNEYLIEQRILPNPTFQTTAARPKSTAAESTSEADTAPPEQEAETVEPDTSDAAEPGTRATAAPRPTSNAGPGASASGPEPNATGMGTGAPPMNNQGSPSPAASQMPFTGAADTATQAMELFNALRDLLANYHPTPASMPNASAPMPQYRPTRDDLQSVLGKLQTKPLAALSAEGKIIPRSIAHLKQDVLEQLQQSNTDGHPPQLAGEDSDTIDLVGMLFDYITQNARDEGNTQSLLTRLQVPMLRVALKDKTFFTQRSHPARQLLNTVAEASTRWLEEEDADPALVEKIQQSVQRVTTEFDGDLKIFDELRTDITQHMSLLARRAEVAERRYVNAAKGREKLERARGRAHFAVNHLLKQSKPTTLLRALLEQAWTDVLALTILRQGEDSPAYRQRLTVADQLLQRDNTKPEDIVADTHLRQELETGLAQVGVDQDDVQAVVGKLFEPQIVDADEGTREEDLNQQTELADKLKSKVRLGGESDSTDPAVSAPQPAQALNEEEQKMLARVKTLPFGTWLEFVTDSQGSTVERKLAWFSTMTGRCLFVNQRGIRTDERSLEQLARDLISGQIRFIEAEQESIIDRAMKTIWMKLKQFTSAAPQPAAG